MKEIGFEPIHDRVVILPDEVLNVTSGGIIIPDSAQKKATRGTVLAAGKGEYRMGDWYPTTVKRGDHVVYGPYAAAEHKIDGETVHMLREAEILGILTEV